MKESFVNNQYAETAKVAQDILAKFPAHPAAQEFQNKARGALLAAQVSPILRSGIAGFQKGDFAQCIKDMERVLSIDKANAEAPQYIYKADTALSKQDILNLIERHRAAVESKDLLAVLSNVGEPALRSQWQGTFKPLFNNYDAFVSKITGISVSFASRTESTVSFSHSLNAVAKKDGKKKPLFGSSETWHLRKQGNAWLVMGAE